MYIVKISQNEETKEIKTPSQSTAKNYISDIRDFINSLIYQDANTIEGITDDGVYVKVEILKN